jgi:lysophospholipase L1-like esterase
VVTEGRPTRGPIVHVSGQLEVMGLGDSFTWGAQSSTGNGYRDQLTRHLTAAGQNWILVGDQLHGTMLDNNNEGWPGWVISGLTPHVAGWLAAPPPSVRPPDYVLLCAGTNDAIAPTRSSDRMIADMGGLLDAILAVTPTIRVLVATLPMTAAHPEAQGCELHFNTKLVGLVATYPDRVRLVDMVGVEIGADGIHPDDVGYADMGDRWWTALASWIGVPA